MDTFSTRLRTLRKAAGYSQKKLAEATGISLNTIAYYEKGQHEPGAYALKRIADALNTSTDYLLGRTQYPQHVGGAKHAQVR